MHQSDHAAVARARDGDIEAFRSLVEEHSSYLFGVVYRLTRNPEDARDVVQDTWLKAHAQLGRFEARAEVRTWLTRIAINCAIDHLRKTGRRDAVQSVDFDVAPIATQVRTTEPAPDRHVLAGEIHARVAHTMSRLTEVERAAFTLRHIEGMSIEEIGSVLGLKSNATKHSIFRAVRKMRAALAPFVEA
jgi:RNA polymerase sigma-70 factor (ECF subfamily)